MTIEDTLRAILDVLEQIAERPSGTGNSSLTVENMVKGPPKITTHGYVGIPITREHIDEQLEAHAYACREADRRQMEGWKETVDLLKDRVLPETSVTLRSHNPTVPDLTLEQWPEFDRTPA